jgi:hypothetical protein
VSLFNAHLAQLIECTYDIWRGAVCANDIFIVCYNAKGGRVRIVSFNVLPNDDFRGDETEARHLTITCIWVFVLG